MSESASPRDAWLPLRGADRSAIPGTCLVWLVGFTEHSDLTWRREGVALVTLSDDGPYGFDKTAVNAALRRLDMQALTDITHYRPVPLGPS